MFVRSGALLASLRSDVALTSASVSPRVKVMTFFVTHSSSENNECIFLFISFSSMALWWKNKYDWKNSIRYWILHFLKVCKLMRFWAEVEMCFHSCNHNLKSWLIGGGGGLSTSGKESKQCEKMSKGCWLRSETSRLQADRENSFPWSLMERREWSETGWGWLLRVKSFVALWSMLVPTCVIRASQKYASMFQNVLCGLAQINQSWKHFGFASQATMVTASSLQVSR